MYREQWVADILDGRSVLAVALDVHMTSTGSMERGAGDQAADIGVLMHIAGTWRNRGVSEFDDAVLALIEAALKEAGEQWTNKTKKTWTCSSQN